MAIKIQSSFGRKFIKAAFIIVAIFVIVTTCLHIWFVTNAKRLLIELVTEKSGGKLKIELSHINFDIFSSEVKIHEAFIASTNNDNSPITYQVSFRKIVLHTNSLWSLVFKRAVEIRQIKLYDPKIEVFNQQKNNVSNANNKLSLGMELGKLYNSIQDAITALNTRSIYIINAKLILVNKTDSTSRPVVFSNIYFTLKHINKHGRQFYDDNKNIVFSSSNQDITFTDGIHKLLFKRLQVQQGRSIILDSCVILALPTKSSNSSYSILFRKLALINVNFDTLYKTNLIKADSVYCVDPVAGINLNPAYSDSKAAPKGIPDLEKILKQFSGNLDLGFVGVKNADIHMNIRRRENRSIINSAKGNFQIKSLRINPDSSKLISIKSFDMIIKGYNLYNADSSVIYSFDSIRFANDKLLLNNFSIHTAPGTNKIRNYRDYSMPYFELLGLNWPELIFKQNLEATEAILHEPTINLRKIVKAGIAHKSIIFNSTHTFDDFMSIDRLKIINGKINLQWGNDNFLQLEGLNLNVLGENLVDYKHVRLHQDVESLFFPAGYLKVGNITASLQNVNFKANDQIHAEQLLINNRLRGIDSKINDVTIKNIYTEEANGNIVVDGLEWGNGTIALNPMPHSGKTAGKIPVVLKNLSGRQTQFKFISDKIEASAFLKDIGVSSMVKSDNRPLMIKGLSLEGREMNLSNRSLKINAANFIFSDNLYRLSKARFEQINQGDSLIINSPSMQLRGNIDSFLVGNFHLNDVVLNSPVINFYKQSASRAAKPGISKIPAIKIDHIDLHEPVINARFHQNLSGASFVLPYTGGNEISAHDIQIRPGELQVGDLHIKTKNLEVTKETEKIVKIDNGADARLSKINISLAENTPEWNATIVKLNLNNAAGFTYKIKDNRLELKDLALGNCMLSSSYLNDISKLLETNRSAWISTSAAKYYTKNELVQCFNVSYHTGENLLAIDSLNINPFKPRDSAIAGSPYQIDYISFNSSKARLYGFDANKYFKENTFSVQKASLLRPSIIVYRDKLPPFLAGVEKKLFVHKTIAISMPLSIKQIAIEDGTVSYTEKTAKTRLEGNLLLSHLNGNFFNIKNYDMHPADSLALDFGGKLLDSAFFSLRVSQSYVDPLSGFLMTLKIEPASLRLLNPLVTPLSDVKFTSGTLDSFYMSAVGNENFATGEMKFYYHGLHLHLLKDGGTSKSGIVKKVENALLNTFVLKENNSERTGLIYFKRLKDRSFFNYMNKIIFSGVGTSLGIKKNNKYRKNFKKDSDSLKDPYGYSQK